MILCFSFLDEKENHLKVQVALKVTFTPSLVESHCVVADHTRWVSDLPPNWTAPLPRFSSPKAYYRAQTLPCHPSSCGQSLSKTPADFIGSGVVHTVLKSRWVTLLSTKLSHSPDSFPKDMTSHLITSSYDGTNLQLWQNPIAPM